jgi:hypothetical protein
MMKRRDYRFQFKGESVFSYVQRDAPEPEESQLDEDVFVYVMGPYTAFDATYAYSNGDELKSPFIEDPLFDPELHITDDERGSYEAALDDLWATLREEFGVCAFLATDIDIPTENDAADDEPSKPVLTQSIEFAAVSDAVVFVFTPAGLTTGAGSEVGAILGEFHLRQGNSEPIRKPRERFRIFTTKEFSSASIDEIPWTYGVDTIDFEDKGDLVRKIQHFLANLERQDPDRPLPIFIPHLEENSG